MKQELEKQLLEAAPLLYIDRYKPPHQTCLAFGFECHDGWFDLLMEASVKIEAEINKFLEEHPSTKCYQCSCDVLDHKPGMNDNMPCTRVHYLPYFFGGWQGGYLTFCWHNIKQNINSWWGIKYLWRSLIVRRVKAVWYRKVNRISQWLYKRFNIGYHKPCHCKGFETIHPRASQVKEKLGTLRFYMSGYTDEISKIIREAEKKSCTTCEHCGAPGKLRDDGWLFTLCDECNDKKEEKGGRAPWLE